MLNIKLLFVEILKLFLIDSVKEQRSEGNWYFRLWRSGRVEAWYSGTASLVSDGQVSSYNPTWYRSHYSVTLPSYLSNATIKTAVCSNTSPTSFHMQGNTVINGTTVTQYCIRGGGALTGDVTASVYVTGTL